MARAYMIESTEALLIVDVITSPFGDKRYFRESEFFGKSLTVEDVIDEACDSALKIYRMNLETLSVPEDITEDVARQYLMIADCNNEFGIEASKLPTYVLQSHAWAVWQDDEAAMAPVGHNTAARLERVYSTLDHKSQGLVRGAVMS